jgi:hypothetical protein
VQGEELTEARCRRSTVIARDALCEKIARPADAGPARRATFLDTLFAGFPAMRVGIDLDNT